MTLPWKPPPLGTVPILGPKDDWVPVTLDASGWHRTPPPEPSPLVSDPGYEIRTVGDLRDAYKRQQLADAVATRVQAERMLVLGGVWQPPRPKVRADWSFHFLTWQGSTWRQIWHLWPAVLLLLWWLL
jgi:hypothetical protein